MQIKEVYSYDLRKKLYSVTESGVITAYFKTKKAAEKFIKEMQDD